MERLEESLRATGDSLLALNRANWTYGVRPVFVVGCARSGTTWLQSMLSMHPEVHTGPETHFFPPWQRVADAMKRTPDRHVGFAAYFSDERFHAALAEMFYSMISSLPMPEIAPRYFLEKSPHHCDHAELILRTFPDARFIHLLRDGRAVAASIVRVSRTWGASWAPKGVAEASYMWRERVQKARSIARQVPAAKQFLEVRYEELRREPEQQMRALFDWLELPHDEHFIASAVQANALENVRRDDPFPQLPRPAPSAKTSGVPVKYPADFVGKAPKSAAEVELNSNERMLVELLTGDLLKELGYI